CLPFINLKSAWNWLLLVALVAFGWYADQTPTVRDDEDVNDSEAVALVWSPYQKLHLRRRVHHVENKDYTRYALYVNDTIYRDFKVLRLEEVARPPKLFDPAMQGLSQYDLPCLLKPAPEKMLVVGAGGGNDVAGGLRHGAKEIVAVEIDPAIIELGKRFHPES